MVGEHIDRAAERAWKHRFAQTLYEAFCAGGVERAAALDDAYAHADAQYLVRGLGSPESEAHSALKWIQTEEPQAAAIPVDNGTHPANPHNGAHHSEPTQIAFLGPDLSE